MSNFGDHPAGFFGDSSFYNGVVTTSTRFESGDSAFLGFTPSSAGNRKTMTFSAWVKRSKLGEMRFFGADSDNYIAFSTADRLEFNLRNGGSGSNVVLDTNALFRDLSAWYHIMFAIDTTQGTDTNRVKLYVNGTQITSFNAAAYPGQNNDMNSFNNAEGQYIAKFGSNSHFSGYMAEVNFIDGLALTPSSFGETKNGAWIPIDTSGLTFGSQGYRLQMKQSGVGTASTSTVGADTSGNTNHWTSSGLVASDCAMPDSPENNFCTLNPLDAVLTSTTISEGNLQTNQNANSDKAILKATFGVSSGKWYWEGRVIYSDDSNINIGVVTDSATVNNVVSADYTYLKQMEGLMSVGNIFQVALNMDDGAWYIGLNNTWYNSATASEIAAGNTSNAEDTGLSGTFLPAFYENAGGSGTGYTANFGQDDTFAGTITSAGNTDANGHGVFKYAPPSGFLALCSDNLPELTIGPNSGTNEQSDDYFNTVLYTGNATDNRSITGFGLKPDWLWIKNRSSSASHHITDTSRGGALRLRSNTSGAEENQTDRFTSIDTDGFTITGSDSDTNANSNTYVAWGWKANGGTTTTNDASATSIGSIDSVIQANTTAGFSIVTYTGTGSAGTVAHGLGAVPKMYIVKNRDASSEWRIYNENLGNDKTLKLHLTDASADSGNWSSTTPTSSVFNVATGNNVNDSSEKYVAYCFAEVEGYSKIDNYIGNSSADGTFVYLGFRPAFLLWKRTTGTDNWGIHDNTTTPSNPMNQYLRTDLNNAAGDDGVSCDFLSNGFKWRINSGLRNTTGENYIYMAFAEAPFKYSNAR